MSLITFVMPTRGKPRQLGVAIRSIAEQVGGADVSIVLLYNKPETDVVRVIERSQKRWPFIKAIGFDGEPDYADKFKAAFLAAPDSEWVWMFGNDDILEQGALAFMLQRLKSADKDLRFIHVTEKGRHTGSGDTYTGRMIDLCNAFGWIEFTGFNTGNICRGEDLARCGNTKHWQKYAKTAFVHSCALLEGLFFEKCQLIDQPLVSVQENGDQELTRKNWAKDNVQERYLYLSSAIDQMYKDGLIKAKLPAKFFRYHSYHLWDRHITTFLSEWINNRMIWTADWSDYVLQMADFVKEPEIAESVKSAVDKAITYVSEMCTLLDRYSKLDEEIIGVFNNSNQQVYPFTFADKKEERRAA